MILSYKKYGGVFVENLMFLKSVYDNLIHQAFSDKEELIQYVNNNMNQSVVFPLTKQGDFYIMQNGDDIYTFNWNQGYSVQYMIEDITRAVQVLNGIELEGVYNTPSLRDVLNSVSEKSSLDTMISFAKSRNKDNSIYVDKAEKGLSSDLIP